MSLTQPTHRPVACIGSRKLPRAERPLLAHVARRLEQLGFTVRSGGAWGSDQAFESGLQHPARAEIYLPEPCFNGHPSPLHEVTPEAFALAERFHPAWHRCSDFARRCHARNCAQVLGQTLDSPVEFVVCWTPNAMDVGWHGAGASHRTALRDRGLQYRRSARDQRARRVVRCRRDCRDSTHTKRVKNTCTRPRRWYNNSP